MDTNNEFQESVSHSCSENINIKYNIAFFECNICFHLAQDPVVTLCGHLFCWPCLYKWLQFHSYSHECPVCKALVDDDNLVPIYGRGTSGSDLRDGIPSRPASQRPQTAPAPVLTYFRQDGSGAPGGFVPMAAARLGDLTRTSLFGAISSLLNFRVVDFGDMSGYGETSGGHYMLSSYAHGGYAQGFHQYSILVEGTKLVFLTICFLFFGLLVVLMVISSSVISS
ncbi:putative transcription factor C2H2 family [Helianthus annuus]|uniref:E3 ubiquitin-protein ligase RMA n=1 Tax=Helianthus annuus TaxID=4232 RepID=A0A251U471_HELAN|nr:E3 ubiquitin ligase rnf-5 [Helianthus annuus]KAF5814357.1 putative transcription factor C2H2 family [Helianthus annuus]KAJ0592985.1 putative transcription factor C2H2 family [Helianthus annuus]KAJ0768064.1 putative transcription factor C2H2 family [Helianthus annuus]KAJ0773841.1 putative transcription factor C2H2 family [Helianthus annuus]KAJ0935579.1 putative transcription factor C2H2 family [Helianthus annuus]